MNKKETFSLEAMVAGKEVRHKGILEPSLELVLIVCVKNAKLPIMEMAVSPEIYHSVDIGDVITEAIS
ncbi:MAG: hypothetical protein WC878_02305 [Candidatus Paceibacterota bacterium]|jgi:hypothetical protein